MRTLSRYSAARSPRDARAYALRGCALRYTYPRYLIIAPVLSAPHTEIG